MKVDIPYLKDTVKIGYEEFEDSKEEAVETWNMYHNEQYTVDEMHILNERGQPAETFNVIKLFSRLLLGYYSTVLNTVQAQPVGEEDIPTTTLLNDVLDHIFRDNNFIDEAEDIKLSGMLTGLMCCYIDVQDTGERDQFNRPINKIVLEYVPESEIIIDPASRRKDYTDARFIHRYKWLTEEAVITLFGKGILNKLTEYYNYTNIPTADYEQLYENRFSGIYKIHNNYLIMHSIVIDDKGKSWSVFWHDEIIIEKKEITHKEVKFPYRIVKVHDSEKPKYYGVFHDVLESQRAINQALIKFQLLVNTQKAFVQENAVENLTAFTNAFNRVSGVIPVKSLQGIKIEQLSREALEQYAVIDRALDRIQRILGINDSFLGMAFASDSGRKVKLQQNATVIALRYLTGKIETFYRLLGWDVLNLVKQYYTATQAIRVADDFTGYRWMKLNEPDVIWSGQFDQNGQPIYTYQYEEVIDPDTNEPMVDDDGNLVIAPIPKEGTELAYTNADISVISTAYNDEDERNQLMMESVIAGPTGQMLASVNPAGYFEVASLSLQSMKTKNSPEIANIFKQTADMLKGNMQAQQEASIIAQNGNGQGNQQPQSQELKLPQNTNEGI